MDDMQGIARTAVLPNKGVYEIYLHFRELWCCSHLSFITDTNGLTFPFNIDQVTYPRPNKGISIDLSDALQGERYERRVGREVTVKVLLNMNEREVTLSWNGREHKRKNLPDNMRMYFSDNKHNTIASLLKI